jgi:hypothetical protein
MIRSIVGVFIGLVVAFVTVAVVEVINLLIFPPPADFDVNDPAALAALIAEAPAYKLVLVPVAWFLAAVTGGWVAAKIAKRAALVHAFIIAALLIAMAVMNMRMIPHPAWFWVAGLAAPLVGMLVAARLAPTAPGEALEPVGNVK